MEGEKGGFDVYEGPRLDRLGKSQPSRVFPVGILTAWEVPDILQRTGHKNHPGTRDGQRLIKVGQELTGIDRKLC